VEKLFFTTADLEFVCSAFDAVLVGENILLWLSTGTNPMRRQPKWLFLKEFSSNPIES